jgi:drug/metabolite transporter (DMT)-like permease
MIQETFMARLDRYRLPILVGIFCTLWSSAFIAAKIALIDCPPLLFLTGRFLLAGTVMILGAALYGQKLPARRDLLALVLLGIINNAIMLGFSFSGMGTVSAGLTALITSCNPILTAIVATALLRERLTLRKIAGLILGFCGVAFIVQARLAGGSEDIHGIALVSGALAAIVTGTILFKLLAPRGGLWVGSGIQNLAGGLALVPIAFSCESVHSIAPTWPLFGVLIYLALGVSMIGLLVWFYLLTLVGATAASSYHFLNPPLGIFFGWIFLNERLGIFDLLGIVPVAYGIYLVTRQAGSIVTFSTAAEQGVTEARRGLSPGRRVTR